MDQQPYDNLKRNSTVEKVLSEIFEKRGIQTRSAIGSASSDIGNVSMICPVFHPVLQIVGEDVPIHTREFAQAVKSERAHQVIGEGAEIIAEEVIRIFTDQELYQGMREDFLGK